MSMSIRGSVAGSVAFSGDPLVALEMMMMDQSATDRERNKLERSAANSEAHALQERAAEEESAAATSRLVGAIVGAGASLIQGVATTASGVQSELAARSRAAGTTQAEVAALHPQMSAEKAAKDAGINQTQMAAFEHASTSWNATSQFASAGGQLASGVTERLAAGYSAHGSALNRQADRAKEQAQDLNEHAASNQDHLQRTMGRMEDTLRAQRQAEDARIANMRG